MSRYPRKATDLTIERALRHLKSRRGLRPIGWHVASLLRHAKCAPAVVDDVARAALRNDVAGRHFARLGSRPETAL